jgi:hypothetical protein
VRTSAAKYAAVAVTYNTHTHRERENVVTDSGGMVCAIVWQVTAQFGAAHYTLRTLDFAFCSAEHSLCTYDEACVFERRHELPITVAAAAVAAAAVGSVDAVVHSLSSCSSNAKFYFVSQSARAAAIFFDHNTSESARVQYTKALCGSSEHTYFILDTAYRLYHCYRCFCCTC